MLVSRRLNRVLVQPVFVSEERAQRGCDLSFVIPFSANRKRPAGSQDSAPEIDQFFRTVALFIFRDAFNRGHDSHPC
jgi:hypothetical protein